MKNKIIEILKKHPNGLKARQIAALLPNANRRRVNQILYDSQSEFEVSKDYVWKLKSTIVESTPRYYTETKKAAKPVSPKATQRNASPNSTSTSTQQEAAIQAWRWSWEERRKREAEERERQRQARQQDPKWQEEKQRLHEQQLRYEYEKEKSRYRPTSKPSSEPVRACVGDCSTCTKEECIMDKLRK